MPQDVPEWLDDVLDGAGPGHARLAVARLANEDLLNRDGFTLRSAAFRNGEELDPSFTAGEEDAVAPPLEWTNPPAGAAELVLIVEDPGMTGGEPYCHWLVWGLAAQKGQLLEGETPPRVGKNAHGNSEWLLPDPPVGEPHDYVFQLFAVDTPLSLMPGATKVDLMVAMNGHVIAAAVLTATYEGGDEDDLDWDEDDGG